MRVMQRTASTAVATQDPTPITVASGPAFLPIRPRRPRRVLAADVSLRLHLRLASELYMRLADLDLRAYAERETRIDTAADLDLFRTAFQHFQIGWQSERYNPRIPEQLTTGEAADLFLRRLADWQYAGHREGYVVLPADVLNETVRWALSLLRVYVCTRCDALTLGTCLTCTGAPRATLRSVD